MDGRDGMPARVGTVSLDRPHAGLTGIAAKGFLLSLFTFGVYRFWYMTSLRCHFWSRTLVDGSPGQYLGTGRELFLGFLVAVAVLVPVYVGIFAFSLLSDAPAITRWLLGGPVLFLLGQFALYRGRRYRASRTVWRGIRLDQDGSGVVYAATAAGWWILTLATLGLAFPFLRARLERYRIGHTLIGASRMESGARGTMVLGPWLLLYAVGLLPTLAMLVALLATGGLALPADLHAAKDLFVPRPGAKDGFAVALPFVAGASLAAALALFPYYRARETRAFMNAARLGQARLISTLRARQFYRPYRAYAAALVVLVLGLVAAGVLLAFAANAAGLGAGASGALKLAAGLGTLVLYLAGAMGFAVLYVRVVQAGLWAAIADTARVSDADALAGIVASSRVVGNGLNEGLADALDLSGALQIGF